jgi:hypothetical protein
MRSRKTASKNVKTSKDTHFWVGRTLVGKRVYGLYAASSGQFSRVRDLLTEVKHFALILYRLSKHNLIDTTVKKKKNEEDQSRAGACTRPWSWNVSGARGKLQPPKPN